MVDQNADLNVIAGTPAASCCEGGGSGVRLSWLGNWIRAAGWMTLHTGGCFAAILQPGPSLCVLIRPGPDLPYYRRFLRGAGDVCRGQSYT